MKYMLIVLVHNEIQYLKLYKTKSEARMRFILLANLWYKNEGIKEFSSDGLTSQREVESYYLSDAYFNSEDLANVIMEKLAA